LGDAAFSKEELAIMKIKDDANSKTENMNSTGDLLGSPSLNEFQRHVAKLDEERK